MPMERSGIGSTSQPSCSVSLEPAGWQAVIENLRRGALQYEAATGSKAEGTIALIRQIQDQLKPNVQVDVQKGARSAE